MDDAYESAWVMVRRVVRRHEEDPMGGVKRTRLLQLSLAVATLTGSHAQAWFEDTRGFTYEVYFPDNGSLPLTPADRANYCAVFESASKDLWEATNGSHYLHTVELYDRVMPSSNYDVTWNRSNDGTPYASGGRVTMYDYPMTCSKSWSTDAAHNLTADVFCRRGVTCELGPCPGGATSCANYERIRRSRCLDEVGNWIPRKPDELGFVMAHETGHAVYHLSDEYVLDGSTDAVRRNAYVCSGQYDNDGLETTSMMGSWGRVHWCDGDTHVGTRILHDLDDEQLVDASGNFYTVTTGAHAAGIWQSIFAGSGEFAHAYNYSTATKYSATPPYPSDPFRCNWHYAEGEGPLEDALVIVDKSGSMGYRHPLMPTGPTALEGAAGAAVSYYNQGLADRLNGVMAFDSVVSVPVPYEPRGTTELSPLALTPGGNTNLCQAIMQGADLVRDRNAAHGTGASSGAQLLLTDGRPTTPDCNDDADVIDAAIYACESSPGRIPVVTYTLGFGDTDHDLLRRVAEVCGGTARSMSVSSVMTDSGLVELSVPLDVQVGAVRHEKSIRGLSEVLAEERAIASTNSQALWVPKGSKELAVEWIGDGFRWDGKDRKQPGLCSFSRLRFELVSPGGQVYDVSDRPVSTEHAYRTHTIHVSKPDAGKWEARMIAKDYACMADAPAPHAWGTYNPKVFTVASVRHPDLELKVWLDAPTMARDDSMTVYGAFEDRGHAARVTKGLTKVRFTRGAFSEELKLFDDGAHGDGAANDGLYAAKLNAGHAMLAPGAYRVELAFTAKEGSSGLYEVGDVGLEPGGMLSDSARTAMLVNEATLVVNNCSKKEQSCEPPRVVPTTPTGKDPCRVTLVPGQRIRGLTVATVGLALGAQAPRVNLGLDVDVSAIKHAYDPKTGRGTISFDAVLAKHGSELPRTVHVAYGGAIISSEVCQAPRDPKSTSTIGTTKLFRTR